MAGRRRGTVTEISPGRWRIRVDLGSDTKGKRDRLVKTVRGTKRVAEAELAKSLHEQDQHRLTKPKRDTVEQYLNRWLAEAAGPGMKPATWDLTAEYMKAYITPKIGKHRLDRLAPLDVQGLYNALLADDLSPATVRRVHGILHSALSQAVGWGLIGRNPAGRELVKVPKVPKPDICFLAPDEAARFLDASALDKYSALWAFLLDTGCRPGEAMALRWVDLNLKTGIATIKRSLTWRKDRSFEFTSTKTDKGRPIPLTSGSIPSLKEHKARQAEDRLKAGEKWQALDLVFCTETGGPLNKVTLGRHLKAILKPAAADARGGRKAEPLPDITVYGLRHTCATLLLAGGVNPKVVSERLGHASVRMTLDKYSHVIPAMQESATQALDRILYHQAGSHS